MVDILGESWQNNNIVIFFYMTMEAYIQEIQAIISYAIEYSTTNFFNPATIGS